MAGARWLFTKEEIANTPSIKNGYPPKTELEYRQQAAHVIQTMGQRLQLNQLCMNTAIVYMHRFYMYHSLQNYPWRKMSVACLFLAAKVEEQPRKLEYVIKAAHSILSKREEGTPLPPLDTTSQEYLEKVQDLVIKENILLQALGFNVTIEHSNTHAVKICRLVEAPKDLSQNAYFLSTKSLLLTTMCLQYPSKVIAAVCIYLACKWLDWELPRSKEGRYWWSYVDESLNRDKLEAITAEFLGVMEKADPKLPKHIKLMSDMSPNSRSCSPAPGPSGTTPQHSTPSLSAPSSHHPHPSSSTSADHQTGSSSSSKPNNEHSSAAKSYAEHKERNRASSQLESSRQLHGESPLVRGDKRPYPKDTHSSSSHANNSRHISPPQPASHTSQNPYHSTSRSHESRHHHRHQSHYSSVPPDGSPKKRPRLGENGNGEQRPPLPNKPPLPRPPPPPP